MKVLVVVVTNKEIPLDVLNAIKTQDYPDFDVLINKKEGEYKIRQFNIIENRNEAREKALKTDADYFLLVDSDVVLPSKAISNLMLQVGKKNTTIDFPDGNGKIIPKGTSIPEKYIMGGWYPLQEGDWNCGKWVADNKFGNFRLHERSVIKVDKIDLGCILIKREVLEKIKFRLDLARRMNNNQILCMGLMFAIDAQDAGYELWMNGDVVCKHLRRAEVTRWKRFCQLFSATKIKKTNNV